MENNVDESFRSERRHRLIEPAIVYGSTLRNERARQHLVEGFNRRVLMLECSSQHIHDVAEHSAGGPLSEFAVPELTIHVNSFWLNLCGALDNLAWGIAYELDVLPGLAEGQSEGRDSVGLAKPKFLAKLGAVNADLAQKLRAFAPWLAELRSLRDPSAHRIPIYPVPGVLQGASAAEAQRMFDEARDVMDRGRIAEGLALIHRGNDLARYEPWITLSHDGRIEVRHLHRQMYDDEDQFAAVSAIVLNRLFRDTPKYRAI